ncbi:Peroxidase 27 [Sesamum alatum]|uniref:Peroxidase n=1 Tax=Sesamum alatum TaxID=300844 RepID=A0AAE1YX59_9LAMI|nr:Peroxidase 27 [Sesamum alatum]
MAFTKHILAILVFLGIFNICNAQGLKLGFYKKTCPSVEAVVKHETARIISAAPTLAAPLLRMHFHDCFVRGCDGSVLLNATGNNQAEKDAFPNLSLRGFGSIDRVKSAVEKKCPGVVSCADILALVARDATVLINGPSWPVALGRRDGNVSTANEALANLPPPSFNITQLIASFAAKGRNDSDPSMDPNYVAALKRRCPATDTTTIVQMDPGSFKDFNTDYYTLVRKRRGLLQTDAALLDNNVTSAYVQLHSSSSGESSFFKDFAESMVKMGLIGVLTGSAGEIRRICSAIN